MAKTIDNEIYKSIVSKYQTTEKSKSLIIDNFIFYAKSLSLSLETVKYCVKNRTVSFELHKGRITTYKSVLFMVILRSVDINTYEELGSSYQKEVEKIKNE
ncbi:MAG: hypothetical protein ACR5K2_03635 [Wolbachia sp.]